MARRDNSDPTGIGQTVNWAFAWPANRRVLYNRASCDLEGKPFNRDRALVSWNGTAWGGADIPDFKVDEDPTHGMGPFIMNPEGVARFFARKNMAEGPFPEHYEPFETPLAKNPLSPDEPRALSNPAARVFADDRKAFGKAERVSARGDDLPPHRAFPLLDQACAPERHHPARAVRGDRRGARQGAWHLQSGTR